MRRLEEMSPVDIARELERKMIPEYDSLGFAWERIEVYLRSANTQHARYLACLKELDLLEQTQSIETKIQEPMTSENWSPARQQRRTKRRAQLREQQRQAQGQAYVDIHFYLNCWRMIARFVALIVKVTNDDEIRDFAIKHHAHKFRSPRYDQAQPEHLLGYYACGRDQFEHFEERYPGSKQSANLQVDSSEWEHPEGGFAFPGNVNLIMTNGDFYVLPTINGTTLRIGNREWDISESSLKQLEDAVGELAGILRRKLLATIGA